MEQTEADLESFRRQWREEVSARTQGKKEPPGAPSSSKAHHHSKKAALHHPADKVFISDEAEPQVYNDLDSKGKDREVKILPEPKTALEHYERAVEKESQGNLGDSIKHYRKAFRLDDRVQESFKDKHYPPAAASKPQKPASVPIIAPQPLSSPISDLVSEFASLSIPGETPPTDASPTPPCPISTIPEEILVHILSYVAIQDVGSLAHVSQVCKRLAYLVMTEDGVWRRVAAGHEFGFAAMHYRWACAIDGTPILPREVEQEVYGDGEEDEVGVVAEEEEEGSDEYELPAALEDPIPAPISTLVPTPYPTFRTLFRTRPRIRFNGCYISTVNYTRPGASSPNQVTWNSPVLIVTYYRYLRFFRNGTCISLLTTTEPSEVIHHLHPDNLPSQHNKSTPRLTGKATADAALHAPLPHVMKDALPGRWKLTGEEDGTATLTIETEGVTPKYLYRLSLGVVSAGRSAKNNKLVWKGYWSYNKLADDWAEFGLKNDRAYWFSRVKSYGLGMRAGTLE